MEMRRDIEGEAAEWLARLDIASSDNLRAEFARWIAADPAHEAAFLRLSATWTRLDRLASLRPAGAEIADDLFGAMGAKTSSRRRIPLALAASGFLAVVALALFVSFGSGGNSYATKVGERRLVRLEDNSSVALNTQSKVNVAYRETERRVEMREGEALFKVAKDPSRPFVVAVKGLEVRAVGTAFDIRVKGEAVEVA